MEVQTGGETGGKKGQGRNTGTHTRFNLTSLSVRRPVTIIMVLGFFVLFGLVAFTRLPVRRLPNVNFPYLRVSVSDPGTNAATVAGTITDPIEKALSSESGIVTMVGTSSPGRSSVSMEFTGGTNIDQQAASVSLALQKLARSLPSTASPPSILKANPNALPMMNIALSGPLASSQLFNLASTLVAPSLQEIPGVSQVTVVGGQPQVVTVNVSTTALSAYGVSMSEVAGALHAQNTSVTGGVTVVGEHELLARVHGGYSSVAQLASVPVASRSGGNVLLGNVASVTQGLAQKQSVATLNGSPAVGLVVSASSTANSLQVDTAIRSALAGLQSKLPPGVTSTVIGDVTNYVRGALSNVEMDLFLGIFIAALILLVFLHRLANTAIVMLAIPVSLVSTFLVMYFLHFSLDLISLMALSLLIGILVDDSIVVLENINRHRAMGKAPADAAVDGRMEIGAAAVAITLTDVVVYAPVAFVSGNVGQLFREFGLTIVAATLFSLLVSFTLTPMLASRWLGKEKKSGTLSTRIGMHFDAGFDWMREQYRHVVRWALRHRITVLSVAIASAVASVLIVTSGVVPTTFVPPEDNGVVTVKATLPPGTPLSTDQTTLAAFSKRLQGLQGVTDVFVSAGYSAGSGTGHNLGQITLDLGPRGSRPSIKTYEKRVVAMERKYPGLVAHAHVSNPFVAGGARAATVSIVGPDLNELESIATSITNAAEKSPAVSQVSNNIPAPTPELAINVNHAEAAYLGVTTSTIGSTIASALGGVKVPPLITSSTAPSEPVVMQLDGGVKFTPAELSSIPIPTGHGTVPLSTVADLSVVPGPGSIVQINREYAVSVSASSTSGNSGPAEAALMNAAKTVGLPTGYALQVGGEALAQSRAFGPLIGALLLSVLLVYMLLAALYESFLDPLSVMFAVPLATVGALLALWASGLSMSIFALLAMIMLMGLVAKNSILLVDYTKTLRKRGYARNDAIVESGATRIRPILMTTATMVGAMLPLALLTGVGASERMPIGTVLIGGLLSSTALSLLVVPVFYSYIDDGARLVGRLLGRHRDGGGDGGEVSENLAGGPATHL
ncbi:MAG: efflux RND transporter permease subunit [Actinobacteria bacterium]|nr:efflux RND transporter permease subunit [Actinomycetota bacterium]MCL5445913.1 efflux RND transporter permease subunit [Actinomycetota bacterium]